MRRAVLALIASGFLSIPGLSQTSPCDLNNDGVTNKTDFDLATDMARKVLACTANIRGAGICDIVVVQRVANAALGGSCVTGSGSTSHSASLTWTASTSPNVTGYNLYRATAAGGPYTKVNASPIAGLSYTDTNVQAGQTYYYVATALDSSNNESGYSNEATATIPTP